MTNKVVRRVEIEASVKGAKQVATDLSSIVEAQEGVAVASAKSERATLSAEKAFERMQRQLDPLYRAQQKMMEVERQVERARNQGLATMGRANQLMEIQRQRVLQLSGANDNLARSTGQVGALANNAASGITMYTGALSGAALGGAVLVAGLAAVGGAIGRAGDEFQGYRNKLIVAGEDQGVLNKRLAELTDIAIRSRTGLEPVVELYGGLSKSTAELGKSQAQVARVVETVSKAFSANGTSAATSAGAILQLNQAFASGVLRGDELNSVLEGAPPLARLIAKEFGVAVGELKSLGEEGKLSADRVFTAFLNGSREVDSTFNATATTISQASTNAGTSLAQLGAELDNLLGIAARVAGGLNAVAGAIRGIAGSVASFGDTRNLDNIKSSLQAIQQYETNIAGLKGKNDYASRQDLAAETAKLTAARAEYDRLVSTRVSEMVGKPPEILLNAEGMLTTAKATRTASKALEDLNKAEQAVAREGMDAVQKATVDANKAFADRQKIAQQMRTDGVESAKIADFEARSQKILAAEIANATKEKTKAARSGGGAAASAGSDAFDNALQRSRDQIEELRLQAEVSGKATFEVYKLTEAHRLRRAAMSAGRGEEVGVREQIDAMSDALARQRVATDAQALANRQLKESFDFVGDAFKSFAEDILTGTDGINGALKSLGKSFLSASLDALIKGGGTLANVTDAKTSDLGALLGIAPAKPAGANDNECDQHLHNAESGSCGDGRRGLSVRRHHDRRGAKGAPDRSSADGAGRSRAEHPDAIAC
jgi:tape measure domain-containing protein